MKMMIRAKNKSPRSSKLRFEILTIFPKAFESYFEESLIKRAKAAKIIEIGIHNIRDFTKDKHHKVDDKPFGGGPGMVMKVEPISRAIEDLKRKKFKKERVILFSTRGEKFTAKTAQRLAKYERLILICGRYEGVDERVAENIADEEISMGDYVLSGGELPAMVLVEAVSRFRPGFLGKYESLEEVNGSFPAYTRPEEFKSKKSKKSWIVPKVLLSGNHAQIDAWRRRYGHSGS